MKAISSYRIGHLSKIWAQFVAGLLFFGLLGCSNSDDYDTTLSIKPFPNRTADFSLWQLDSFFEEVQMGYILRSDDKKLIVIDGGGKLTAPILEGYLQQFGGKVDTWILTHPHSDHIGAVLEIMDKGTIKIDQILHVPLAQAWIAKNEPENYDLVERYNQAMGATRSKVIVVRVGDKFDLANGVHMEVFGGLNESIVVNAINNSSMTFKISGKSKSILFLGDLGLEGGQEILKKYPADRIKADYVQMAHHGQTGVDKDFYAAVKAQYALWPTPKWLWNNQLEGKAINSGTYKTLVVRSWMESLDIKENYVSGLEGNLQID
tara:strand:- start:5515 stop:6474 length:960 start_codon:yes stop_codon:yes gene_type:complete